MAVVASRKGPHRQNLDLPRDLVQLIRPTMVRQRQLDSSRRFGSAIRGRAEGRDLVTPERCVAAECQVMACLRTCSTAARGDPLSASKDLGWVDPDPRSQRK